MQPEFEHSGILKNRLLAAIARSMQQELPTHLKSIDVTRGTVLAEPGDPIERIVFPEFGVISLVVTTADGKNVEANVIGREGAVGLHGCLGGQTSFVRAVAQTDCRLWSASAMRFGASICRDPSVRELITQYTALQWAESQQIAACNAVHDTPHRLCRILVQSAERTDDGMLSFTQEVLSEWLGVQRTTITLLLKPLQERGIVQLGRARIHVLDLRKLRDCACSCAGVLATGNLAASMGIKL